MSKSKANPLLRIVQNFFGQYLTAERQLSSCTVSGYRDTFRLLLAYTEVQTHRSASEQRLEDWDTPSILGFLEHLEKERHCCVRSRNVRLAAIHCFMRYVGQRYPEFLALAGRVLAIPNKRCPQPLLGYLSAERLGTIFFWSSHRVKSAKSESEREATRWARTIILPLPPSPVRPLKSASPFRRSTTRLSPRSRPSSTSSIRTTSRREARRTG